MNNVLANENVDNDWNSSEFPLVSIIMPAYNHEKYVEAAIRSVWAQDYRPLELVVLDDGSTDGTYNTLKSLLKISPVPMVLIKKDNEGITKTLNLGLEYAKGKYASLLASDDEYSLGRISRHVTALENTELENVAGCYGDYSIIDENGDWLSDALKTDMNGDQFQKILQRKSQAAISATTFHLTVMKKIGFDEELFFEDWDFFLRLTDNYSLFHVPGMTFRYRRLDTGANRNIEKMIVARRQILEKYRRHPKVIEYGVDKFEALIAQMNSVSFYHINDYKNARVWLYRAWRVMPNYFVKNPFYSIKVILGRNFVFLLRKIKKHVANMIK